MSVVSAAQVTDKKIVDKLLPLFKEQMRFSKPTGKGLYTVAVTDLQQFEKLLQKNKSVQLISTYAPAKIVVIECSWSDLEKIISDAIVLAVDATKKAKEELLFGFVDYAANRISTIHNRFSLFNAAGINLSVKEQKFDTSDIDFKGRILPSTFAATTVSGHASIMATMMAGGGNTWYNTKGAAWGSRISSASFDNLLPEPNSYYNSSSILVQNHSYGTVAESYYGAEAAAYDASVINNPSLVHIFSAGNSGTQTPATGPYATVTGYSNLTGNFKHAKNIITVGHTDSFGVVLSPSSKGPAFDGRVKPELVAFGEDGSSGAAALVSGIAGVLHHTYKQQNNGNTAPASLIKAVLLNSADDVESPGIDFKSGYGNANAFNAVNTIVQGHHFTGLVSASTQQQFNITIPAGIKQLKVTLVWSDPQSTPNTTKALLNDLDLELTHTASSTTWQPWVLNSTASMAAIQQLPVRKRDSLNVVEQISIDNPAVGDYIITVKGFSVPAGAQTFSIAYQFDTADTFRWDFPTSSDHLFPNQTNVLRFKSGYSAATGQLEMSTDAGSNWQTVDNNVDLSNGYYKLSTLDLISKALLRMRINTNIYASDTFTISKRIGTAVGFACVDSFLLLWDKVPSAAAYRIRQLGNQYMEPLLVTTDTFAILSTVNSAAKHYSITAIIDGKETVGSYTFNYETAGTGCYVKAFLADLNLNNEAALLLELGTTLRIKRISFEKQLANGFTSIAAFTTINQLQYSATDQNLHAGSNRYRAVLELTDGRLIYSEIATLYFTGNKPAVVYPNPVPRNGSLTVLTEQDEDMLFQLIDTYGRVVLQNQLNDYPQQISVNNLAKGMYYFRLLKKNKKVQTGIVIIN
ncbi:S8 family peptidase [Lacibacter sp. H407]|uniref:S8 family peptidase n=1 Tax=Lacibacter sp. H407 TaxID=3133423 RepID=UPI0030C4BF5B